MDFSELIRVSRLENVLLRRPFRQARRMSMDITCHHIILTPGSMEWEDKDDKEMVLHRNVDQIDRRQQDTGEGSPCYVMAVKCKDLRVLHIEVTNLEDFNHACGAIEKLSAIVDILHSYPFRYNHDFKLIEDGWSLFQPEEEYAKLLYTAGSDWRISYVNADYSVCPSYPRAVVVPAAIPDDCLVASSCFRQGGRFPVLSYRHGNGAVIGRCSQPLVGPNNRRCREDERLLSGFLNSLQRSPVPGGGGGAGHVRKACYIVDTRTAAVIQSAKAKGGGCEVEAHYPGWKRLVRSIDRYHFLLESYSKMMEAATDLNCSHDKWLSRLTISSWLTHVKDILTTGCLVAQCIERDRTSVVVHGSEGLDITLCVTAIAQVILNPDFRTVRGFEALVEKEWLQAGHPFWSRTSKGPFSDSIASKSRRHAPTFTMFLDCVWQVLRQFPCSFEFTDKFLIFLADQAYASNFGSFLADSEQERHVHCKVRERTVSLWSYVNRPQFLAQYLNSLYEPNVAAIWPSVAPVSLCLWRRMYLRHVLDQGAEDEVEQVARAIMEHHVVVRQKVMYLRRQLEEIEKEAMRLGLIDLSQSAVPIHGDHQLDGDSCNEVPDLGQSQHDLSLCGSDLADGHDLRPVVACKADENQNDEGFSAMIGTTIAAAATAADHPDCPNDATFLEA